MSVKELLTQLAAQGVRIEFVNDKLSVKAEKGKMTPKIMAQLKQNKERLIEFFVMAGKAKMSARNGIKHATESSDYPLSPAQNRLWLTEQVYGQSSTYHMPLVARLTGEVDVKRLEYAFNCVLEKHEILRTRYIASGDMARQIVDQFKPRDLKVRTFVGNEKQLINEVHSWVNKPFELSIEWPIRLELLHLTPNNYVLLGCVHHIACDGWSLGILQNELANVYNSEVPPSQLPLQYKDYAVWIDNNNSSDSLRSFWQRYLDEIRRYISYQLLIMELIAQPQSGKYMYWQLNIH